MSKDTSILWADSSVNPEVGCNGCELWGASVRSCYAGRLVEKHKGKNGWPKSFGEPALFPERIAEACKWPDLRGTQRPPIPSHFPRLIFLDDMGDTFTESLDINWLMPYVPLMERSSHIWLFLTKRPRRMAKFFRNLGHVPANFWLGTSITNQVTADSRLKELIKISNRFEVSVLFASAEPLLGSIDIRPYLPSLDWVMPGGESGPNHRELSYMDLSEVVYHCLDFNVPVCVKQDANDFPGMRGNIPDELWLHQFPDLHFDPPPQNLPLF